MPRPPYTKSRQYLMQIVVWIVFAAAVAAAAGVIQWKEARFRLPLTPPQQLAGMEVRLPVGWMVRSGRKGATPFVYAAEQRGGGIGRTLTIFRTRVTGGTSPDDVLEAHISIDNPGVEVHSSDVETLSFALGQGAMVEQIEAKHRIGMPPLLRNLLLASVVTGDQAIVMEFAGSDDPSGRQLMRDVAKTLKLIPEIPTNLPEGEPI